MFYTLIEGFIDGLMAKRPALFNLYTTCQPEHGVGDDLGVHQAKLAVESRAYPIFKYNPENFGNMVLVDVVMANVWMAVLLLGIGKKTEKKGDNSKKTKSKISLKMSVNIVQSNVDDPIIHADRQALNSIIVNLIENAAKYLRSFTI